MLRIVPQVIPADNEEAYRRAVEEVQRALRRAVAAQVAPGASFGDLEGAFRYRRRMQVRRHDSRERLWPTMA